MRKLLLPALLLALLCGCDDLRGLAKDIRLADLRQKIDEGKAKNETDLNESDWREGERDFAEAIADPRFPELSTDERAQAWRLRGALIGYLGDHRKARTWKLAALKLKPVWPRAWMYVAHDQLALNEFEGAARSLLHALQQDPNLLPEIEDSVFRVIDGTDIGSRETQRLLELIPASEWVSLRPDAGEPWRRLALERLHDGDRDGARKALKLVVTPDTLIRVRIDKRFDGLYDAAAFPARLQQLAGRRMEFLRDQAARQREKIWPRIQLAQELTDSGKFDETLKLMDEVIAAADSNPGKHVFEDDNYIAQVRWMRADALDRLGRYDEAMKAKVEDATLAGAQQWRSVQALAAEYCYSNSKQRLQEVLDRLAKTEGFEDNLSYHYFLHCSAVLAGDKLAEERELDYLRQHRDSEWVPYFSALERSEAKDEAAAEIIERLHAERSRSAALMLFQYFKRPGDEKPSDPRRGGWLIARGDVKAAVEAVGRIESFDVYD